MVILTTPPPSELCYSPYRPLFLSSHVSCVVALWLSHKCDGFLVASNKTEASLDIVDMPHDGGPEEYEGMWQKVRSMWSFVYDNYYDDFDWFHMGGDDMYVIVENLRLYLESDHIQMAATAPSVTETDSDDENENGQLRQMPLYLGRKFALEGV